MLGLIGYIVPLQIGARGVALPRLNQLSYWLYLAGAADPLRRASSTARRRRGTLALPPLSDLDFSPTNGADAWIAGAGLACLGFVCFAINMIVDPAPACARRASPGGGRRCSPGPRP